MKKLKMVKRTAAFLAITTAIVSLSSTTSLAASDTRQVSNPFLPYLAQEYNAGNMHYGWSLDSSNNGIINLPADDNFTIAASGAMCPMAAMLGGASRVAAASQADLDPSIGQETFLLSAFPELSNALQAYTGSGHGTIAGTNGASGVTTIENSGAQVIVDKPAQDTTGEWYYNGNITTFDNDGITMVPVGYMANPTEYEQAISVMAGVLNAPTSKVSTFNSYYENYISQAHAAVSAQTPKKVLYVHSFKNGKLRTAYSEGYGINQNDGLGYLITYYITNTLGCTNVGDLLPSSMVTKDDDGKEMVSNASDINAIFTNPAYKPDAVVFCNNSDYSALSSFLSTDARNNLALARHGAAPCGMYDLALRAPDTALAPAWLSYVIFGTSDLSTLKTQASDFYTNVYGYTPTSTQLDTMYQNALN